MSVDSVLFWLSLAHNILIWQYQNWLVNQTYKKKLLNWKTSLYQNYWGQKPWMSWKIWYKVSNFSKTQRLHLTKKKPKTYQTAAAWTFIPFFNFCFAWMWRYPVWLSHLILKSQHCCCCWKSYIENFIMLIWKAKSVIMNNLQDSWK